MTWWEQGFVVLDTETTSADPERALLASICTAYINPADREKAVRNALVAVEMPAEASAVNGLTTERLMAEGKPAADVLDEYCEESMTIEDIPLSDMPDLPTPAEMIAGLFHATYETLAPDHGYETREASAVAWDDVPENNKALMVATVQHLLDMGVIRPGPLGTSKSPATGREVSR